MFIGQYYVNTAGRAPSIGSRTQRAVHRAWDSGHSGSYTKHRVVDTAGRGPIIEVDTTGRGPIIGVDTTDRGPSIRSRTQRYGTFDGDQDPTDDDVQDV